MSNPVVTVTNNASRDIFVDSDPNWDDQELMINGQAFTEIYTLAEGATITVSVNWESAGDSRMIGVIFANEKNYDYDKGAGFYQLTVGQDPNTGNLGITDNYTFGQPDVYYTLSDQAPWSMTMGFKDAS